jgi:hypothetical protein
MATENKIPIFVKTPTGLLYEIEVDQHTDLSDIAKDLRQLYPNEFSAFTKIFKIDDKPTLEKGDILGSVVEADKRIAFKKMFTRDNSICLYIGVKLFDCIQNLRFYEEGEEMFLDEEEISRIYSKFLPGTTVRGPNQMGADPNRLNITKKNEASNDYLCSMGNYGKQFRGSDLKQILLSNTFEQSICFPAVNAPGIPFYIIKFQFKPDVVDKIVEIASSHF